MLARSAWVINSDSTRQPHTPARASYTRHCLKARASQKRLNKLSPARLFEYA